MKQQYFTVQLLTILIRHVLRHAKDVRALCVCVYMSASSAFRIHIFHTCIRYNVCHPVTSTTRKKKHIFKISVTQEITKSWLGYGRKVFGCPQSCCYTMFYSPNRFAFPLLLYSAQCTQYSNEAFLLRLARNIQSNHFWLIKIDRFIPFLPYRMGACLSTRALVQLNRHFFFLVRLHFGQWLIVCVMEFIYETYPFASLQAKSISHFHLIACM